MLPVVVVYPDAPGSVPLAPGMTMERAPISGAVNVGLGFTGLDGLIVIEPPSVRPDLYRAEISARHRWVFGYHGPWDRWTQLPSTLPPLWPVPEPAPRPWDEREDAVAVMARPHRSDEPGELYSLREWLVTYLRRWIPVHRIIAPFGQAKIESLSYYRYCLCPENMVFPGYRTEKLVDALAAGCVPLYLGYAPPFGIPSPWDIGRLLADPPSDVDARCRLGMALAREMEVGRLWQTVRSTIGS